ncbi:hypothetical protein JW905_17865 [bacterium]|nr:hypothetical protein [candidate division CSSED10-310 bacterium]
MTDSKRFSRTLNLLLCLFLATACGSTFAATVYVSPTGSDSTGDGSQGNPYGTIQYGINSATAGDTVFLMAGLYTTTGHVLTKEIIVQGAGVGQTIVAPVTEGFIFKSVAAGDCGFSDIAWATLSDMTIAGKSDYMALGFGEPDITLRNLLIDATEFGSDAAVYYGWGCGSGTLLVENCTIVNSPSGGINADTCNSYVNMIVRNTIIADCAYAIKLSTAWQGQSHTYDYNCYYGNGENFPWAPGGGVRDPGPNDLVDVDPLFAGSGDYHLQAGSPCIDAGNPAPQYNDADGSRNDIGCYGGPGAFTDLTANAGSDKEVLVNTLTALDGSGCSYPNGMTVTYHWTQDPGNPEVVTLSDNNSTTAIAPTFTATTLGTFIFNLVIDDGMVYSDSDSVEILVRNPRIIYIPADYSTIGQGLEAALAGDTVHVSPGTYYEHELEMVSGVTLQGSTEGLTTIDSQWYAAVICADNAILENFLIKGNAGPKSGPGNDGKEWYGATVCCYGTSPIIRNNLLSSEYSTVLEVKNSGAPVIVNNIFCPTNPASQYGMMYMYVNNGGIPIVRNNIFCYYQATSYGYGIYNSGGTPDIANNNFWNVETPYSSCTGVDDTFVDPLFVLSPPADLFTDLALQSGSPCIDTGMNGVTGIGIIDMAGNPRIADGDGDSSAVVDKGVFEFQPAGPDDPAECAADPEELCLGNSVTLSGTVASGMELHWFETDCGIDEVFNPVTPASDGTLTYYGRTYDPVTEAWSSGCCPVQVTVNALPEEPTACQATPAEICLGETTVLSGQVGSGEELHWFGTACGTDEISDSVTPNDPGLKTYYARAYDSVTGCWSETCATVEVLVNDVPGCSITVDSVVCAGSTGNVASTGGGMMNYYWFITGGTAEGPTTEETVTYTAGPGPDPVHLELIVIDDNICQGMCMTDVPVSDLPSAPVDCAAIPDQVAFGGSTELSATVPVGVEVDWYMGACGGTPVGTGAALVVDDLMVDTTFYARARDIGTGCASDLCCDVTVTVGTPVIPAVTPIGLVLLLGLLSLALTRRRR